MENGAKVKYCPLIRKECARGKCEWWVGRDPYARCAVASIDDIGFKLFKLQQTLEGRSGGGPAPGGGGGGGFNEMPPPDDDFDQGPF